MPLSYVIHNRTLQVQEVEVTIEPSDAFMFSGQKQVIDLFIELIHERRDGQTH